MSSVRLAALAALSLAAVLGAGPAGAQVYRIVGPDGKVTFSDRPPADAKATPTQTVPVGGGISTASLPAEVRDAASRYPVTLYTTTDCAPCDAGRSYLQRRGIPYTETTVTTREDYDALQRLSGGGKLPLLTLGTQQVPGYAQAEWTQYFDAAGYPATSKLPPNYRNAEPRPLVAVRAAPAPTAAADPAPRAPQAPAANTAPRAPAPSADNPAGIRF